MAASLARDSVFVEKKLNGCATLVERPRREQTIRSNTNLPFASPSGHIGFSAMVSSNTRSSFDLSKISSARERPVTS